MSKDLFFKLCQILEPKLNKIFFPWGGGKRNVKKCQYLIDKKMLLIITTHFSSADAINHIQIHNVGLISVYGSVG